METWTQDGAVCRAVRFGGGALIVLLGAQDQRAQCEQVAQQLRSRQKSGFTLLCVEMPGRWNDAYSPWPAPAAFGNEAFGGRADKTLRLLQTRILPEARRRFAPEGGCALAGYSLAGLFALWALQTAPGLFYGAASCSGSLWFDGFADACLTKPMPRGCCVYLSLGAAEEHTRSARMAGVGDATRRLAQRFSQDENVRKTALVWHKGGHFAHVPERIAEGVLWLADAAQPG